MSGPSITASHMQLAALKELTVRFIAGEMRATASRPLLREFLDEFSTIDPDAVGRKDSLSTFLNAQHQRAWNHIQPKITPADRALANSYAAEVKRCITQRSCAGCQREDTKNKRKPYRCGEGAAARDALQLHRVGNCIRPIRGLYEYWHQVVVTLIGDWAFAPDLPGIQDLTVTLSTESDASEVTSIDPSHPFQVSGATEFLDQHVLPARASDVSLTFTTTLLDWNSILAVPWLLTHELVCHAFQGKRWPNTPRNCEPDCPFYEGWMDEVAFRLLQGNLASGWKLTKAAKSAFLIQHEPKVLDAASAYRRWRYGESPLAPTSIHAPQWNVGRMAAEDALRFFERWHQNEQESTRKFWALRKVTALSFRLQRLDPGDRASEIVTEVGRVCAEGLQDQATLDHAERIEEVLMAPIGALTHWIKKVKSLRL